MPQWEADMKKTTGICFLAIVLALGAAGGYALLRHVPQIGPKAPELLLATEEDAQEVPDALEIMKIQEPYRYVLQEKDGVLVVYEYDGETVRMETGIQTQGFDDATRLLLRQGIHVKNDEELYDLLESYSS